MYFDSKIDSALNLTPRQQLFAEIWFNQVHEYSLDAFRVRVTITPAKEIGHREQDSKHFCYSKREDVG